MLQQLLCLWLVISPSDLTLSLPRSPLDAKALSKLDVCIHVTNKQGQACMSLKSQGKIFHSTCNRCSERDKLTALFVSTLQFVETVQSKDPLWAASCERVKAAFVGSGRGCAAVPRPQCRGTCVPVSCRGYLCTCVAYGYLCTCVV